MPKSFAALRPGAVKAPLSAQTAANHCQRMRVRQEQLQGALFTFNKNCSYAFEIYLRDPTPYYQNCFHE